jgi:hypothetical protein
MLAGPASWPQAEKRKKKKRLGESRFTKRQGGREFFSGKAMQDVEAEARTL